MATPLGIDIANSKSLADFCAAYLPPDTSATHPHSGPAAAPTIELQASSSLAAAELDACFALIAESSKADYAASRDGWKPRAKKNEMRLLDLKYLLVRAGADAHIAGFASFMPTVEDGVQVLYVYEIHLAPALRGRGVGARLMAAVEGAARRMGGVRKVMLTCFVRNARARAFYEGLGYARDPFSPEPRVLRDGRVVEEGYVILSKEVEGGEGA